MSWKQICCCEVIQFSIYWWIVIPLAGDMSFTSFMTMANSIGAVN